MLIADTPTLGLLIGLPIAALGFFACIVVAWLCLRRDREAERATISYAGGEDRFFGWGAVVCAIVIALGTCVAMWPFKHDYHFWVTKEGTVERVSKRLVRSGEGMEEKVVVVLDGQPYGITDTRATLLKPGDHVRLGCKKAFQWGSSVHGWDCRWERG